MITDEELFQIRRFGFGQLRIWIAVREITNTIIIFGGGHPTTEIFPFEVHEIDKYVESSKSCTEWTE